MADWAHEAHRANLSKVTLLSDPPRYEFRRDGFTYGPFLYDEADAFIAGLSLARAQTEPDKCDKQPEPTEADSKLAALTACTTIVNKVDPDFRSNVIQALAKLFGIELSSRPQRPMRNYLETLQRTRSRIIAAAYHNSSAPDKQPWHSLLVPLNAVIAEAEADG